MIGLKVVNEQRKTIVADGSLFPFKISWLKMTQGSRKVEMIQLSLGHYGTLTSMAAAAGSTGRSGFQIS